MIDIDKEVRDYYYTHHSDLSDRHYDNCIRDLTALIRKQVEKETAGVCANRDMHIEQGIEFRRALYDDRKEQDKRIAMLEITLKEALGLLQQYASSERNYQSDSPPTLGEVEKFLKAAKLVKL